ncbi:MAG TPA: OadG family transporter subunit [Chloroflexota bacterium]
MQGLNVTIYGLGIVFLALLILMFSIMVLGKLFEVSTGKQLLSAVPSANAAPAAGVSPAQTPAIAPVPSAFSPGTFKLSVGTTQHQVEVKDANGSTATVVVDGNSFKVQRADASSNAVVVNGKSILVEARGNEAGKVSLVVDGRPATVQLSDLKPATARATAVAVAEKVAPAAPEPQTIPGTASGEQVTAPLPGKVMTVAVKPGDVVKTGDELCVIEAMKMGNSIRAQRDGAVQAVLVAPGETVTFGTPLFVIA